MERKLVRPHSMDEALSQREQHGMDALPIAGGQSLLVMLRNKLIDPKILLDLEPIASCADCSGKARASRSAR